MAAKVQISNDLDRGHYDHDGRGLIRLIFVPLQPSKPLAPDSGRKCSKLLHKREIIWAGDDDVENTIYKTFHKSKI